jgi:hypothetical protein
MSGVLRPERRLQHHHDRGDVVNVSEPIPRGVCPAAPRFIAWPLRIVSVCRAEWDFGTRQPTHGGIWVMFLTMGVSSK